LEERLYSLLVGKTIIKVSVTDKSLVIHLDDGESLEMEWPGGMIEV
jgi:hypothetical protein